MTKHCKKHCPKDCHEHRKFPNYHAKHCFGHGKVHQDPILQEEQPNQPNLPKDGDTKPVVCDSCDRQLDNNFYHITILFMTNTVILCPTCYCTHRVKYKGHNGYIYKDGPYHWEYGFGLWFLESHD